MAMDIDRFVEERKDRWRRMEEVLDRAEHATEQELGPEGMRELLRLYRLTSSDLNQARSLTADPELLERLNALAGRGYRFIYRSRRQGGTLARLRRFLGFEVPEAYRQEAWAVGTAAAALLLGALFGALAVIARPSAAEDLIPPQFFTQSPRERVEQIESQEERIATIDDAALFGAQLYTHNIRVSFLAFSLSALTLVAGVWILFYNGILLGAVATTYLMDGASLFFFAWVGPHGALELPSIAFAGAAGLVAGRALFFPGALSRGASLRRAMPRVWRMMVGVMLFLVAAGLIEGSFSQFSAKTVPYSLKIAVALVLHVALLAYLFVPRQETRA
ncbi:MAG TPA: stage II sporulation protein M [Thermoanaerobaculia bacterium]|nr:stage II sporulation protein M [Thermoanaerobaculia bacterium]